MKKTVLFLCIAVLAMGVFSCKGGGKYSDVTSVMEKYKAGIEKFAAAMDGVKDADGVVTALNGLTEVTKSVAPQLKAFETKYPELKTQTENPPAELKPLMDKMMAVSGKMMGAMGKIQQYMTDPKVMEANQKLSEATASMK
jgi:hypothetical protein